MKQPVAPIEFNTVPGGITWLSEEQAKAVREMLVEHAWHTIDGDVLRVVPDDECPVTMAWVK